MCLCVCNDSSCSYWPLDPSSCLQWKWWRTKSTVLLLWKHGFKSWSEANMKLQSPNESNLHLLCFNVTVFLLAKSFCYYPSTTEKHIYIYARMLIYKQKYRTSSWTNTDYYTTTTPTCPPPLSKCVRHHWYNNSDWWSSIEADHLLLNDWVETLWI